MNTPHEATFGQYLVNRILPEEFRDYNRTLYKKEFGNLLSNISHRYPDQAKELFFKLGQLSSDLAQQNGGLSFSVQHLLKSPVAKKYENDFRKQMKVLLNDESLTDEERKAKIVAIGVDYNKKQKSELLKEQFDKKNPVALSVMFGAKGSENNINSLLGSDYFYENASGAPVPFPVLNSYSSGLTPSEYSAGSFGARKGVMEEKLSIRDTGALAKDLVRMAHRQLVTSLDSDQADENRGYITETTDGDNIGALLSRSAGGYPRNTIITNKVLKDLEEKGINKILVRSPIVGGAPDGGLYSRDVGIYDKQRLPVVGENPSITAAQAMTEPLTQGALSGKHTGGVYGATSKAVSGFKNVRQLMEVPEIYANGAAHSEVDGPVTSITEAPAGGYLVTINGKSHHVPQGQNLLVKRGDVIEAGDVLSDGLPNPSKIVEYKGIGEGRAYFVKTMYNTMRNSGMGINRRNIELISRSLINHVQINDFYNRFIPGEIVPYSTFEAGYVPPTSAKEHNIDEDLLDSYLERPVLHYSIGTKIRPSVVKNLKEFGINSILVSKDEPAFTPHMLSTKGYLRHDPDWLTRMYGSHLSQGFLDAAATSASSNLKGTSFVAGLSFDPDFGRSGKVKSLAGPLNFKPVSLE